MKTVPVLREPLKRGRIKKESPLPGGVAQCTLSSHLLLYLCCQMCHTVSCPFLFPVAPRGCCFSALVSGTEPHVTRSLTTPA